MLLKPWAIIIFQVEGICGRAVDGMHEAYQPHHKWLCCETCRILLQDLKRNFYFVYVFLLSFMMKIAGNEIMRYFLLLAHEKIFTFSCTFLRRKSVVKLHFARAARARESFYFMRWRRKIIMENYTK